MDIDTKSLDRLRAKLTAIRTVGLDGTVPQGALRIADDCLGLLKDVRELLRERAPKLQNWKYWGPGYWYDNESAEHGLSFGLYPKKYNDRAFACGLILPKSKKKRIAAYVDYWSPSRDSSRESAALRNVMSKGNLDALRMAELALDHARLWKLA